MTLEDFFTLTEIKDGLTAPARVEELVNVMQKEKDCVVENVCDATRQWSTVASTIAATENKDCLDRFIQLGGIWFIDRWLKDAQKFSNDRGDGFTEESTIFLLRAIGKLHIDNKMSISSGVWTTVKNLIGHKSSTVQDQAKAVFAGWTQLGDDDKVTQNVEKANESLDAATAGSAKLAERSAPRESSTTGASPSKLSSTAGDHAGEAANVDNLPSRGSNDFHLDKIEDEEIQKSNDRVSSCMNSDPALVDAGSSVPLGPPVEENLPTMEESPRRPPAEGTASIESCSSPIARQDNLDEHLGLVKPIEIINDANRELEMETSQNDLVTARNKLDSNAVPVSVHADDILDSKPEYGPQKRFDGKDENTLSMEPKREMNDYRSSLVSKTCDRDGECSSSVLKDSIGNQHTLGKNENPDSSPSEIEDIRVVNKFAEQAGSRGEISINASNCLKPERDTKDRGLADMELEYGLVDALEVARKVAKEVAREAVHYKDSFCSSSSEKVSGGSIEQPSSPDSVDGKDRFPEGPSAEASSGENLSPEASPMEDDRVISSENMGAQLDNCTPDVESPHEGAQEPEVNTDKKGLCAFDLNQDVCSEDVDQAVGPNAAAVSIVSASRPTAAPGFPEAPLQFEGAHGWKGTATTSAFRPASPRRFPDGDKPLSSVEGGSSSKQRQGFLDIDLNVAEGADIETCNSVASKQAPELTFLSSGESSAEVNPVRPKRPKLDLNRIDDGGDTLQSDGRAEWLPFSRQNDRQSPSHASSSSPARSNVRNIDLNDPSFCNSSSNAYYGGAKPDDPVISLMGMRVEVSRKDSTQVLAPLQNGRVADHAALASLQRMGSVLGMSPTMQPHAHPPGYGFHNPMVGPSMPYMYRPGGAVPYMVDSRGAPVVPQLVTSGSAASPPYAQPSFVMNLAGPPPGFSGAGPSRPSFDLNSGFTIGGSREPGAGLRQLFGPNDGNSMEERARSESQASLSLGIGEKRKEPETGWEPYLFGSKLQQQQQQQPWR